MLCLERDLTQPDRIVGELLQPGGYLALKRLGLAHCTEGIDAQRVTGYALFKDGVSTCVEYPLEGQSADIAGRSFHHGRFIQKLRHAAAAHESVTMRQAVVLRLVGEDGEQWDESAGERVAGVTYKVPGGQERTAFAHLSVACDGMYSMLRKHLHAQSSKGVRCAS